MKFLKLLLSCILVFFVSQVFAQKETQPTVVLSDSVMLTKSDTIAQQISLKPRYKIGSPLRAALLSAALPGAGQYYNKKAWLIKVPIIYGLGATLGYLVRQNHNNYRVHRENYLYLVDENPATRPTESFANRQKDQVQRQRDSYRRDRDYYVILSCVLYVLQIGEATTTAHLNNFDIDDDISLRFRPQSELVGLGGERVNGLSLILTLR